MKEEVIYHLIVIYDEIAPPHVVVFDDIEASEELFLELFRNKADFKLIEIVNGQSSPIDFRRYFDLHPSIK